MSFVVAVPEVLGAAATDLAGIGSSLSAANAAAAPTTGILAAAEDEVSAAIAALFSSHGTAFQALSAQAADFHAQFVQALNSAKGAYAAAEAANAGLLQTVAQASPVPNVAVSVSGFNLLHLGSATATSGTGDFAVAVGANSNATADHGYVYDNSDTAIALGAHSTAEAVNGSNNFAFVLGTGSTAIAGSPTPPPPAATGLAPSNNNVAVALGDALSAGAHGSMTDIVTPFGTL